MQCIAAFRNSNPSFSPCLLGAGGEEAVAVFSAHQFTHQSRHCLTCLYGPCKTSYLPFAIASRIKIDYQDNQQASRLNDIICFPRFCSETHAMNWLSDFH